MEKARVRETGEIVDAMLKGFDNLYIAYYIINNDPKRVMSEFQLEFFYEPDYWEKLKHQYAGMAMQGMLSNAIGFDEVRKQATESGIDNLITLIAGAAADYATALVEKLKSESNEKTMH